MTDAHDTTTDNGKEPSNNTTRRRFLGYSGAAAVTAVTGTTVEPDSNTDTTAGDDGEPVTDMLHGKRIIHSVGDMTMPTDYAQDTEVFVNAYPEAVNLTLSNELGTMRVTVLPEHVDALCEALQSAKQNVDPERAAETREWIGEKHDPHNGGDA